MKIILYSIILILISICDSFSQYNFYNIFDDGPNFLSKKDYEIKKTWIKETKIKIITEWKYKVNKGVREELGEKNIYKYDLYGNMTENTYYDKLANVLLRITYSYDLNENLVEESWDDFKGSITKGIYEYDENQYLRYNKDYDNNGKLERKTIYSYNDYSDLIQDIQENYSTLLSPYYYHKYLYDYNHRLSEIRNHATDGSFEMNMEGKYIYTGKVEYNYSQKGYLEKKKELGYNGVEQVTTYYTYNEDGKVSEKIRKFFDNTDDNCKYKYDYVGLLTEINEEGTVKYANKIIIYVYEFYE